MDYRGIVQNAAVVESSDINPTEHNALVRQNVAISHYSPKNIRLVFWPVVFCVNVYDFLGLCHLVPTHTLHLSRPFLMTTSNFQVFQKNRPNNYQLEMISN